MRLCTVLVLPFRLRWLRISHRRIRHRLIRRRRRGASARRVGAADLRGGVLARVSTRTGDGLALAAEVAAALAFACSRPPLGCTTQSPMDTCCVGPAPLALRAVGGAREPWPLFASIPIDFVASALGQRPHPKHDVEVDHVHAPHLHVQYGAQFLLPYLPMPPP